MKNISFNFEKHDSDFQKAHFFVHFLLKFFCNLDLKKNRKFDKITMENLKFNQKVKFLILPIVENLMPKLPENEKNLKEFYPFQKEPAYFLELKENFTILMSANQPVLIEFLCQKKCKNFSKKFILKKGFQIETESCMFKLLKFINNLMLEDSLMKKMDFQFPIYNIISLTTDVLLIEFVENIEDFEHIYQKHLLHISANLAADPMFIIITF